MSLETIDTDPLHDPDYPDPPTLEEYLSFRARLRRSHSTPTPRQTFWPELPTSYIPLDASAALWNQLIRKLGVPEGAAKQGLRFEQISCINENRPKLRQEYKNIYALIIALPINKTAVRVSNKYQPHRRPLVANRTAEGHPTRDGSHGSGKSDTHLAGVLSGPRDGDRGNEELIVFLKQSIESACGLFAIFHALFNGPPPSMLGSNNLLTEILRYDIPRTSDNRALALELNKPLEETYTEVAIQGDSAFDPVEAEMRYVCLVKSRSSGTLYHLDAKRSRPSNLGLSAEGVFSDKCLDHANLVMASTNIRNVTILALVSGQAQVDTSPLANVTLPKEIPITPP